MSKYNYFCFLRHGEYHQPENTPSAHLPYPLTELGEDQSKESGQLIYEFAKKKSLQIDSEIHCSTLLRAYQTAKNIKNVLDSNAAMNASVIQTDYLCERSVGSMANLTIQQIEEILLKDPRGFFLPANWKSKSEYKLPVAGAESLIDAGKRVKNYIKNVLTAKSQDNGSDQLTVFVGHGASFRHAAYLFNVIDYEDIAKLSMYHAKPIFFCWNSIKDEVLRVDGEWKIRKNVKEGMD